MRTNREIVSEIIETARKLERIQIKKDNCLDSISDGSEESEKRKEERILDCDFSICQLAEKLNTLCWLFEDGKE